MRAWLGSLPEAALVQRMFTVILIALFVQSISTPLVSIARSAGRALPETLATLVTQAVVLAVATRQTDPVAMVATLSIAMAVTSLGLWLWLLRSLELEAPPRELAARLLVLAAGTGVVVLSARLAAGLLDAPPQAVVLVLGLASLGTAAALSFATGLVSDDERVALLAIWNRARPRRA
jgi:hypothetical protein